MTQKLIEAKTGNDVKWLCLSRLGEYGAFAPALVGSSGLHNKVACAGVLQ